MKKILIALLLISLACSSKKSETNFSIAVERMDPSLDSVLSTTITAEIIATGFDWSEGPLWVDNMLLFSDVPRNIVYKWTAEKGVEEYLKPSGYTSTTPRAGEPGSNGLTLDRSGNLLLCQHGDRRIARMNTPVSNPKADFTTVAGDYQGKKFNSPNDLVVHASGELFFTDPPYGLVKQENDSSREISFQGVFKADANGKVTLLIDSLTRPNGIAFSPDGRKLFVANSDPDKARWYAYDVSDSLTLPGGSVFFDATPEVKNGKGLPDGLKIDKQGTIFATGPGGIWIFNVSGKTLGRIKLTEATSNCALSPDEKTLYVTNDMHIVRIKLRD